ncbi:MAG: WxL domain-containing protein [Carnobacterium sp.]|uniref:WxL domain-containing protein n=1 Tax=Carnobacterium sp. TaxID=48221 RepID=UPI002FCA94C8
MNVNKFFLILLFCIGIFLTFQVDNVHAEIFESKITVPLYGSGTTKDSVLTLTTNTDNSDAKITFTPGDPNDVMNTNYTKQGYYSFDVFHSYNREQFDFSYNYGEFTQSYVASRINAIKFNYGDIIKFYLPEPTIQKVENANGTTFSGLYPNSFYLITPGGFIPLYDTIIFKTYDNITTLGDVNYHITSFFGNQVITASIVALSEKTMRGLPVDYKPLISANNSKFNTNLADSSDEYSSLRRYTVNSDHKLSLDATAVAQPSTTIGNFNSQIMPNNKDTKGPFSGSYGSIYRVYTKDVSRVSFVNYSNFFTANQPEIYYEYTKPRAGGFQTNNLKELDFNKVSAKNVTVELGSSPNSYPVTSFSTVSSYPPLSSSFGGILKTDTVGSYDLPITIKQPLVTNSNYVENDVISKITVVDTIKPTGTVKSNLSVNVNGKLELKDMFSVVDDNSGTDELIYSYVGKELDTTISGKQTVIVRIQDASKNFTDFSVPIEVIPGKIAISSVDSLNFGMIKSGSLNKDIELSDSQTVGISIQDDRGTKEGWDIQAEISDFMPKTKSNGKQFTAGVQLPQGVVTTNSGTSTDFTTYDVLLNKSPQTVVRATAGKGFNTSSYTFGTSQNPVSITEIPSTIYAGGYEATITWSIINAPN